jgi:hypothetical protein
MKSTITLKLSEKWDILEDFDGNYYILNLENGDYYEIDLMKFKFLSLLDGERTLEEIINIIAQNFPKNKISDKNLGDFLEKGLRKGFLKKCFI